MKRNMPGSLYIKIGFITYILFIVYIIFSYLKFPYYLYQTDLMSFITGASIIRDGRTANLYDEKTQLVYQNKVVQPFVRNKLLPFRNIPLVGVMYVPFTYINLKTATIIVFAINIGMLFLFHKLFTISLPEMSKIRPLWFLPLIFWPSISAILVGQHSGLILLIYTFIVIFLFKKKYLLAGIFSSFLIIRPQNMLLIPLLFIMVRDKVRFTSGFLFSSMILLLLNIFATDITVLFSYPKFVMFTENIFFQDRELQISSIYFAIKGVFPFISPTTLVAINISLYLLVLVIFIFKVRRTSLSKNISISVIVTILFSIHVLSYDLLILLLPIYLIFSETLMSHKEQNEGWLPFLLFFIPVFNLLGISIISTIILILVLIKMLFPGIYLSLKKVSRF